MCDIESINFRPGYRSKNRSEKSIGNRDRIWGEFLLPSFANPWFCYWFCLFAKKMCGLDRDFRRSIRFPEIYRSILINLKVWLTSLDQHWYVRYRVDKFSTQFPIEKSIGKIDLKSRSDLRWIFASEFCKALILPLVLPFCRKMCGPDWDFRRSIRYPEIYR